MTTTQQFTREQAIRMNKERCKNPVLIYVKDEGPIYEKDIRFMAVKKCSNTDTFIITNRTYIALANKDILEEIKHKNRLRRYKEDVLKWRQEGEKEEATKDEPKFVEKNKFMNLLANFMNLI
jgi:hypothetical protein